jgi:hypothetical protein
MEMSAIVSENRITAALTHNVPSSMNRTYKVGEEVLVFREKENIGQDRWLWYSWKSRLYPIKDLESERVLWFTTQQIKPFLRDSSSTDVDEDAIEITHAMQSRFTSTDAKEKSPPFQVHLSDVIEPSDPRATLFDAAKQKKVQGLIERGMRKVVLKDEMPENPNIMGGRFVLTIKDFDTSKEI